MDLLNWGALIAPGVILGKDGSCLAGWRMRGLDTESMEPDVFESWMATLALRLSEFGDDHVLWVVFHRRALQPVPDLKPTGQQALDVLAIEMNELLAAPGTLWADELTLFFSWTPEVEMAPEEKPAAFADECALLETRLDHILGLTRLDRTEADGALRSELCARLSALTGTARAAPGIAPDTLPVGLDALFGPDLVQDHLSGPLRVSGRPLACLTIEGLRETYPRAPLAALQDVQMAFAWVTRFAAMSPETARASALWNRKLWHQSGADMIGNITGEGGGRPKLFEAEMAESADQTVAVATRGEEGFGRFVPVLLVYGDPGQPHDALAPRLRILREALGAGTLSLREERANAVPAFLSALPGHVAPNPRARMARARVMADFMPVRGIDRGRPACPSALMPKHSPALLPARARTGELFHFNLHVGDVGHTLLFGPTGGGKSVLLGLIASAWLRYPGAQVIFFDRHRSVRHACNALGGTFLEPGTGAGQGLAPMAHVRDLGAPWAVDWLCELVRQGTGTRPSPEQAEELGRAALDLMRTPEPGLRQVQEYVQDAALRQCLEEWLSGPLAGTFDRDGIDLDAGLDGARLTVFETAALLDAREAVTVLSLDYIFAQVARRFDGRPALVILDEAWSFLGHDIFAARIRSWLKEGRKMNVAVLMATQSISDAVNSALITDLLDSCPTRIFLPNPQAQTSVQAPQYRALQLDPAQIALIAAARPKNELYLMQAGTRRLISFALGPAALSVLGQTSQTASQRAGAEGKTHPDYWKEDLIRDTQIA